MKAYTATAPDYYDDEEITVFADNPGEAKAWAFPVFEVKFTDVRVKRDRSRDHYAYINGRGPWDDYVMNQYFEEQRNEWLYEMRRDRELMGW